MDIKYGGNNFFEALIFIFFFFFLMLFSLYLFSYLRLIPFYSGAPQSGASQDGDNR